MDKYRRCSYWQDWRTPASAPVIVWIGVVPETLPGKYGNTVAIKCKNILCEFDITDVDVEIRESFVTRSAGPKLLEPVDPDNPTADVHGPLNHAIGLPIAAQATPYVEGTGGFFMAEGGDSKKLLLVTARHVVFPPSKGPNNDFKCKSGSQAHFNVLLLGDKAYQDLFASILARIGLHGIAIEYWERRINLLKGKDSGVARKSREEAQRNVNEVNEAIQALYTFYQDAEKNWNTHAGRVLGHVVCSPPISLGTGPEGYTEDYAIIEVDDDKIDRNTFQGNAIDLGTKTPVWEIAGKLNPNKKKPTDFKYPIDHLLKLRGTIKDEEMRHPTTLDQNDEPCLIVIKNGKTTGVTTGRANGVMSFVQGYFDDDKHQTSKEWAIFPYDNKSDPFSAPGDSGSIIADGRGHTGGLLTGGSGATTSFDITYATPINSLIQSIKANGYPNAHLNPT